jgi:hypothetical protein
MCDPFDALLPPHALGELVAPSRMQQDPMIPVSWKHLSTIYRFQRRRFRQLGQSRYTSSLVMTSSTKFAIILRLSASPTQEEKYFVCKGVVIRLNPFYDGRKS